MRGRSPSTWTSAYAVNKEATPFLRWESLSRRWPYKVVPGSKALLKPTSCSVIWASQHTVAPKPENLEWIWNLNKLTLFLFFYFLFCEKCSKLQMKVLLNLAEKNVWVRRLSVQGEKKGSWVLLTNMGGETRLCGAWPLLLRVQPSVCPLCAFASVSCHLSEATEAEKSSL